MGYKIVIITYKEYFWICQEELRETTESCKNSSVHDSNFKN